MFKISSGVNNVLPREFRKAAGKLFPKGKSSEPSLKATEAFANDLGIGEDYRSLKNIHNNGKEIGEFLERFQNNLDLLIQKTWVEKADEARKNALLDKVPPFVTLIEREDYLEALREFGIILQELSYLFFGNQSQKEDFTEYTFRIDLQMGLFWWYGSMLGGTQSLTWIESANKETLLAILLLGICYLTNF